MSLTILSVGYTLAPVGPDAVGGSEQVLAQLDAALTRAGHRSLVIGSQGSTATGTLIPTPQIKGQLDEERRQQAQANYRRAIGAALKRWDVDLVHMHGLDFHQYLPNPGVPVLVTLHLPPDWYPDDIFSLPRPDTYLHCVSASQRRACPPEVKLLPEVANGVPVERLGARHPKRRFAMALGRICPEKGYHFALDAASLAGIPLVIAGEVFQYETHVQYFEREILPRLGKDHRFIGPVGFARKRRLLTAARCLLVPSLVSETSSLVAMEALACGTPVIAFPSGALPEIVEHGKTGFLVQNYQEMAEAIEAASEIDPEACRNAARARFSLDRMVQTYFTLYEDLVAQARSRGGRLGSARAGWSNGQARTGRADKAGRLGGAASRLD